MSAASLTALAALAAGVMTPMDAASMTGSAPAAPNALTAAAALSIIPGPLTETACVRQTPPDENTALNIRLACEAVDGTVLAPGAGFSFNAAMGPVRGRFKPGPVVSGGRIVRERGGGICQVSTALYQSWRDAGLEVVERSPHSTFLPAIDYCRPGGDAAVTAGGKDLKLRNNGLVPLRLRVRFERGRTVRVVIWQRRPSAGSP